MHKGKVLLLDEVSSTQDAAIEHELQSGDVCVSFNQISGRGRRGNFWDGTGGVAVTVVLDSIQPHIPIAVAVTLAGQLNNLIPHATVGIKWPNDLLVNGKKLAGILIEQRQGRYLVGIGVNVLASPLPTSTSLNEIGAESNLENVAESSAMQRIPVALAYPTAFNFSIVKGDAHWNASIEKSIAMFAEVGIEYCILGDSE